MNFLYYITESEVSGIEPGRVYHNTYNANSLIKAATSILPTHYMFCSTAYLTKAIEKGLVKVRELEPTELKKLINHLTKPSKGGGKLVAQSILDKYAETSTDSKA